MRQILAIACSMLLAFILMDTYQVVKAPSGLTVVKAGQALAADLGRPPPLLRLRLSWRQSARGNTLLARVKEKPLRPL
jgi:hypothetical protein